MPYKPRKLNGRQQWIWTMRTGGREGGRVLQVDRKKGWERKTEEGDEQRQQLRGEKNCFKMKKYSWDKRV